MSDRYQSVLGKNGNLKVWLIRDKTEGRYIYEGSI